MIKKMEKAKVDRLFSWILATQNFNYTNAATAAFLTLFYLHLLKIVDKANYLLPFHLILATHFFNYATIINKKYSYKNL